MTPRHYYNESAVRKDGDHLRVESSAAVPYGVPIENHCAYNRSRERFLSAEVDVADCALVPADNRLAALTHASGAGLWLVPFKSISATSVRVPVDLIYLDQDCAVIDTVESFPISRASILSPLAASVLVLPAETIQSTETQPGDQLILCPPHEMKQRLRRWDNSLADPEGEETAASVNAEPARAGAFRLLQWEDPVRPKNPAEAVPVLDPSPDEVPNEPESLVSESPATGIPELSPAGPAQKPFKPARTWLQRLLSLDPPNVRDGSRESFPSLIAYFFTGGAPEPHSVRDISLSGTYVLTKERWYIGTVVRITLTDRFQPTVEHSITLNMTVVRWGNDGVGLKFLLQSGRDRGRGEFGVAGKMHVDHFLQQLRYANN
jgi:hypothetical protein